MSYPYVSSVRSLKTALVVARRDVTETVDFFCRHIIIPIWRNLRHQYDSRAPANTIVNMIAGNVLILQTRRSLVDKTNETVEVKPDAKKTSSIVKAIGFISYLMQFRAHSERLKRRTAVAPSEASEPGQHEKRSLATDPDLEQAGPAGEFRVTRAIDAGESLSCDTTKHETSEDQIAHDEEFDRGDGCPTDEQGSSETAENRTAGNETFRHGENVKTYHLKGVARTIFNKLFKYEPTYVRFG